ncbi:MAG: hypothetical protein PHS32_00285 [Rhodoferax sp.]|uniref:hypothetical protein n=1 Tax=Rhodoferax sp. TaxID=50421 RepID=UPI00262A20CB|nr:hypothetical protein [Rhodoferax sp.]MDD5332153.1 hypothetical protein [Rhodoferax sp.]
MVLKVASGPMNGASTRDVCSFDNGLSPVKLKPLMLKRAVAPVAAGIACCADPQPGQSNVAAASMLASVLFAPETGPLLLNKFGIKNSTSSDIDYWTDF